MSQGSSNPTTNLTKVNGVVVSVNSGTTDAGTQRVILATNQPVIPVSDNGGSLTVDGSVTVSGTVTATGPLTDTQLRATAVPVSLASVPSHPVTNAGTFAVQVSSALPAGTNNIGDVDILSIIPGVGATNLGKQTDSAAGGTDTGVAILAIRDDALTTLTPIDGDYTRFRVNSTGRLWTSATIDSALPAGANNIGTVNINGTVPVSGTFWQATQPVSLAALPSLPAGTNNIGDVDVLSLPALPTGANTIGNVNINGTVPVSGTFWQATQPVSGTVAATQSGAWNITNISGTVSLPTGAATAANQATEITALQLLDDAVGTTGTAVTSGMYRVGGTDGTNSRMLSVNTLGHVNIADGGNSITVDGAVTVSGTVTATGPLTNTELRATAVPVSGTITVGNASIPITDNAGSLTVDAPVATPVFVRLSNGTAAVDTLPVSGTFWQATQPVSIASVPSHPVTNAGTFAVQVSSALPAGTNNIGDVDVLSLPALPAGTNNIGDVDIVSLPGTVAADITATRTGIELLDNTVLAASTAPTVTNQSLVVSLGPNSKAYDSVDDMLKVKSVQKKFRDSFNGVALDTAKWDSSIGTGGSITVSGGTVTIASGTTIAAETSITSKEIFTIPFRVSAQITLSQRIANQSFIIEAISVNASTGIPDGLNTIAWVFDGVTATQGKYRVANGGGTALDSAASTITTTATTGGVYELEPFADEAWFHSAILDSTAGRAVSYRRHQQIPDPNAVYKIRCRWLNGGVAPATSSNAVMQFVACQDYAELTAEITAGRGNAAAGQAIAAQIVNTVAVTPSAHAIYPTPIFSSTTYQPTNATTTVYANSLIVKAAAGALYSITGFNSRTTPQFIQIHNTTTVPADGVAPQVIFYVPAMSNFAFDLNPYGRYFATGITICNSSTGPTKTIGAADCWFDVQYK